MGWGHLGGDVELVIDAAAYWVGLLLLAGVVWVGLTIGIKVLDRLLKNRSREDIVWVDVSGRTGPAGRSRGVTGPLRWLAVGDLKAGPTLRRLEAGL
jgi:hypothetical protein